MFLIASLAFSFLIAVHMNTMRFHQVIVQHNFIFPLDVFALVHMGAGRQTPNTASRADGSLQVKTLSALVTWKKLNKGLANSQSCSFHSSSAPHRAVGLSWVRRKHTASKGKARLNTAHTSRHLCSGSALTSQSGALLWGSDTNKTEFLSKKLGCCPTAVCTCTRAGRELYLGAGLLSLGFQWLFLLFLLVQLFHSNKAVPCVPRHRSQ